MQAVHEASAPPTRRWRMFRHLLACIRFDEVLILQGPPLLGALFSMDSLTFASAAAVALLAAGSTCLVAHVFVLNDWSGMSGDLRDPNRMSGVFINRGVTRANIGQLWMALLVLGILLLGALGWQTLTIAVAVAGLSALYSAPASHIKGVPFLNSALHLAGGLLHFLLGYSVFRAPDGRGVEIGCFLALVFTAGHLTHETRDSESDRAKWDQDKRGEIRQEAQFHCRSYSLHDGRRSPVSAGSAGYRVPAARRRRRVLSPARVLVVANHATRAFRSTVSDGYRCGTVFVTLRSG